MRLVHKKLICFVFVAFVIFSLLFGGVGGKAYAAEFVSGYSNVIEDLQKDKTFNVEDYPAIDGDYSLQVIQIAESTAGELFVYVYQPAANVKPLVATQINMSLTDKMGGVIDEDVELTDEDKPKLYDLTLINTAGVFAKYKVTNFKISSVTVRYYNITSIYRAWVEGLDEFTGNDNTISEVSFPVGKLYTSTSENGQVSYSCEKREVVTVTDKYVDFLRYKNGVSGLGIYLEDYTDSHIIAFSTDWNMSDLYDVTISFYIQPWEDMYASDMDYLLGRQPTISSPQGIKTEKNIPIKSNDIGENVPSGWLKSNYHFWNRIQTVDNFKVSCGLDLSNELKENLKGKQWVLQFYESDYSVFSMGSTASVKYTKVTDETILRLHFKSAGKVYNLGVVDDKRSGDDVLGNEDPPFDFWQWLADLLNIPVWAAKLIVYGVGALIVFAIALPILSLIFPVVGQVVKIVLKAIWWVISAPFRFIGWIIRKIRGGD